MSRGTKSRKPPSLSRAVVAENVRWRMMVIYGQVTNPSKALAADARLSHSTVQRVLGSAVGASVDILEALARALGCSIQDLFEPSEDVMRALGVTKAEALPTTQKRQNTR